MVIKWSDFAKSNLKDFIKYSKLSSPNDYADKLVMSVYILEDNPRAGKDISENFDEEIRQLVYGMHRIIYRIYNNEIHILMVLHANQDLQSAIKYIEKYFM